MDVSNEGCHIEVQNNVTGDYIVQNNVTVTCNVETLATHRQGKNFHVNKSVESFSGRDQELQQLNTWLETSGQSQAVISGLPGYGKTELARHFALQCKQVRSVLWLDAESPEVLEQSFRELLRWLGAGDRAALDVRSVVQDVYAHFTSGKHLFVFDNAPDHSSIEAFLRDCPGLCLFTSHMQDWGDDVQQLPLQPLSMAASLHVLRAVLGDRFQDELEDLYRQLADLLSRVPLALQVAAAFLRQQMRQQRSDFSLSRYVRELQQSCQLCIVKPIPKFSNDPYKISILEAIKKTLHKIENNDVDKDIAELSLKILNICAYLNCNKITLSDLNKFTFISTLSDKIKLNLALSLIEDLSFIKIIKDKRIEIHRLIQESILIYQSHIFQNNQNPYYIFCLEYISLVCPTKHSHSILKVINTQMTSFNIFYETNKSNITSTDEFFYNLIECNSNILNIILENLGPRRAVDVINARCLLHCAVWCRQQDVLEQLLARGASIEQRDQQGNTALLGAVSLLNLPAVKTLTSHNADVNARNSNGNSVLHRIVAASGLPQHVDKSEEAVEGVRWLVERGARIDAVGQRGRSLIHTAALVHSPHIIPHLVHGLELDVNAVDINKRTPLHYLSLGASGAGADRILRTAECLLGLGANLSVVDGWGDTPVDDARRCGLNYLADYLQNPPKNIHSYVPKTHDFANTLRAAVAAGDVESLAQQLDELEERAVEVADTCHLLHTAAQHEQHEALDLLLERGVDVNSRSDSNDTALNIAALYLHLPCMDALIRHGADVNAVGSFEKSVLHWLIQGAGDPEGAGCEAEVCEMLRRLVSLGARTDAVMSSGQTIIHWAARSLRPALVRFVVTELQVDVNALDEDKWTALHWVSDGLRHHQAEEERGVATARCLLELGACRDALTVRGNSPSQDARSDGYTRLATVLDTHDFANTLRAAVAAGDVESLSQQLDELEERAVEVADTYHLLHTAAQHGEHEALELLLERGVDVNSRDDSNDTTLNIAALYLHLPCMDALIRHGADVNAVDSSGQSVLHRLIDGAGDPEGAGRKASVCEMLRRLVSLGARTDAVTSSGGTIIHYAAHSLRPALVRCVVTELQVDVNAVDEDKWTALHWVSDGLRHRQAEEERGVATARCLLELGACRDALDAWGDSPSQEAQSAGYTRLATVLDVEDTERGSASAEGGREDGQQVEDTECSSASAEGGREDGQQVEDTERGSASAEAGREDGQQVEDTEREGETRSARETLVAELTSWFVELWTR